ncbi:hypothetical protein VTN77DRAFT_4761 [Rasamsonia byssochlamydoides]|uniref:uncharacterized protein n=1 Tax=Rasamsonia byssochlamydoides TaxID=89139 RepID=UPI003744ACDF
MGKSATRVQKTPLHPLAHGRHEGANAGCANVAVWEFVDLQQGRAEVAVTRSRFSGRIKFVPLRLRQTPSRIRQITNKRGNPQYLQPQGHGGEAKFGRRQWQLQPARTEGVPFANYIGNPAGGGGAIRHRSDRLWDQPYQSDRPWGSTDEKSPYSILRA